MWLRNLTFIALLLVGFSAVAAGLLRRDRIEDPPQFAASQKKSDAFRLVVERVNQEFREHLEARELQSAPRADDLLIARRLSIGLTGTIPSVEEIRALEAQDPERRVDWWLERLLADRRSADFMAERFARSYVGTEGGPFLVFRRRRFVTWLSDRLLENRPYDELVRHIISDKGVWTDSPAVNFLTVTITEETGVDPIRLAARTTRAFLGMRIDCLQCHDDRLGNVELGTADEPRGGKQSDFHQLAAFYAECHASLLGVTDDPKRKYTYQYLDAEEETEVAAEAPFASELLEASAEEKGGTLRDQLGRWVTHPENRAFARSTVNRVWALMVGRPLVHPIDDIPLHGPFGPALETLAEDFVKNGHDLRRLIRVIAATEVFQADSRAEFEVTLEHETHGAVFPLTRMRPEQMAGSMIQSANLRTIDANAHIFAQLARYGQQNEFIERYGDMGDDEFVERGGTIAQRLLMMNGDLVKDRTKKDMAVNAATRIAQLAPDDAKAIEIAYLAVLTRRPTPTEQARFLQRLQGSTGDERSRRLEDLYWVLFNSSEFGWNH